MSFRRSGSQQSNASNGARFGVEMKELQPLQANHSKLKEEFCTALQNHPFVARWFRSLFVQCCGIPPEVSQYLLHIGSRTPQAESQLRSATKSAFCCEVISQPFLCVCEISQTSFSPAKWSLVLPDICVPTLLDLFFRYFCINFHFLLVFSHSCNSLARKYPRKGKLPSYINSLASTVIENVIHIDQYIEYTEPCSVFSFSFIFIFLLTKLWGFFLRGWEAKLFVSWSEESRVSFHMHKLEVVLF